MKPQPGRGSQDRWKPTPLPTMTVHLDPTALIRNREDGDVQEHTDLRMIRLFLDPNDDRQYLDVKPDGRGGIEVRTTEGRLVVLPVVANSIEIRQDRS